MSRMFAAHRHRMRAGSEPAVSEWIAETRRRSKEVRKSQGNEGGQLELVLLEQALDGDHLVFILEYEDYDRPVSTSLNSALEIDAFYRNFLAENGAENLLLKSTAASGRRLIDARRIRMKRCD